MWSRYAIVGLFGVTTAFGASSQEFELIRVASIPGFAIDQLKPNTIIFNDQRKDDTDINGFIRFDDWSRLKPAQKKFLNLHPSYTVPTTHKVVDGVTITDKDEIQLYVVEARFKLARSAALIDLKPYTTLPFIESIDSAIKHQIINPSETTPLTAEKYLNNQNPDRKWCEGSSVTICIRSHYNLEGKFPLAVALANKIGEADRKVYKHIDLESELRLLSPSDVDGAELKNLIGLDSPITGVLEQNIFYVNQMMRFGKFVAVLQSHPTDISAAIATVLVVIAVSSNSLEAKKEYQDIPLLRNLVPIQVLMGNSSLNTGNSISAGLPIYARNWIKSLAKALDK